MIVKCLIENSTNIDALEHEHGLSLYVETEKNHIVFDFGASSNFVSNALSMNVDLTQVNAAVLSHGHYDHGGGMRSFLNINNHAKVYVKKEAFEKHYSMRQEEGLKLIGIDETLFDNRQITFTDEVLNIDDEMFLFSDVTGYELIPLGNQSMLIENNMNGYQLDPFSHEQNLIIKTNRHSVLFAGCSHKGIINIMKRACRHLGKMPDVVIGGFHLKSKNINQCETEERIEELGTFLLSTGAMFYTCHCTGIEAYKKLKIMMKDQIEYLSTGQSITIE